MRIAGVVLTICAVVSISACGDGYDEPVDGPRREMLVAVANNVILPTYERFLGQASLLVAAAERLDAAPDAETLAEAQAAWRAARKPWKQAEAFRFGPTEDLSLRIRTKVDWSPIRASRIEDVIRSGAELTAAYVDTLGTNRRGFLAIEYLLFDAEDGNAAVVERLTRPDGDRRRRFVLSIARDIETQAGKLLDAWDPSGGDFFHQFVEAGRGSDEYEALRDALDDLVGAIVLLSSQIEENKIGRPAGIKSNGEPRPESVEAPSSGDSLVDVDNNLRGIENVYEGSYRGRGDGGLGAIVAKISPAVDLAVRDALTTARQTVRRVDLPLARAVIEDPDAVAVALAAATELRIVLSVDLISVLGTTPRFIGDGD